MNKKDIDTRVEELFQQEEEGLRTGKKVIGLYSSNKQRVHMLYLKVFASPVVRHIPHFPLLFSNPPSFPNMVLPDDVKEYGVYLHATLWLRKVNEKGYLEYLTKDFFQTIPCSWAYEIFPEENSPACSQTILRNDGLYGQQRITSYRGMTIDEMIKIPVKKMLEIVRRVLKEMVTHIFINEKCIQRDICLGLDLNFQHHWSNLSGLKSINKDIYPTLRGKTIKKVSSSSEVDVGEFLMEKSKRLDAIELNLYKIVINELWLWLSSGIEGNFFRLMHADEVFNPSEEEYSQLFTGF